ncbi:MAG TPA: HWE histidine kinase domain-containing protein [Microvirga sp.]|nr:HWE histidine kinase domain-containing protein [Microvirga sp.]
MVEAVQSRPFLPEGLQELLDQLVASGPYRNWEEAVQAALDLQAKHRSSPTMTAEKQLVAALEGVEQALRECKIRLDIATEAAELGIWDWNLLTNELISSDRMRSVFGFSQDEAVTLDRVCRAIHPEDWPQISDAIRDALGPSAKEMKFRQLRIVRPDGAIRWIAVHGQGVLEVMDGKQCVTRYVGTIQDVTAQKRAEAALYESEAKLTAAADNLPHSMIYQIVSSRDGLERKFVYVSRSCLSVNGVPAEEVLKDASVLYNLVLPEYVPVLVSAEQEAFRTLKPMDVEISLRHAMSGEIRWARLIWAPRLTLDGRLIWDGVQIDITERRLAQDAIKVSEERLRRLLERMPIGVSLAKIPTGEVLFQNATSIKLLGQQLRSVHDPCKGQFRAFRQDGTPCSPNDYPFARTVIHGETIEQEELVHRRADGSIIHLAHSSAPIRGIGDETLAMDTFYDVTERTRAEEHLRLLVNELNHRVKNTLATVQSIATQSLRDIQISDSNGVAAARAAFEARLFALARAHNVMTRENWESADLADIVSEAVAPYRDSASGYDPFRISGTDTRLSPQAALSLSLAFHELCTNAVKYGALRNPGGRIEIGWDERHSPEGWVLAITWKEHGGPPVAPPARRGFGTRLIEHGLARELNGEVHLSYAPTGLICTINVPLQELLSKAHSH